MMNIEELIERYMDGDLDSQGMAEFNRLISSDPAARDAYLRALEFKEMITTDKNTIYTPPSLFKETEEKVMANIMGTGNVIPHTMVTGVAGVGEANSTEEEEEKSRKGIIIPFFRYGAVAAVVLAAFILFDFDGNEDEERSFTLAGENVEIYNALGNINSDRIKYIRYEDGEGGSFNSNTGDVESEQGRISNSAAVSLSGRSSSANVELESLVSAGIENSESDSDGQNTNSSTVNSDDSEIILSQDLQNIENESISPEQEYNRETEVLSSGLDGMDRTTSSLQNNSPTDASQLPKVIYNESNNITPVAIGSTNPEKKFLMLSTHGGNDFSSFGVDNTNSGMTSFSLSAAYRLGERHHIGIEGGRYIYGATYNRIDRLNNEEGTEIVLPVDVNLSSYFGSAFYQYDMPVFDDFYIDNRVGVGYGQLGPMGFVRSSARYVITGGLGIRLGAEFRGMYMPGIDVRALPNSTIGSFTLIYGLDYSL